MMFRVSYMSAPGVPHVYCRIFVAARPDTTFANIGNLTMRHADFAAFRKAFNAEFIEEDLEDIATLRGG